ncbi:MBL fold metallo-hydrolase [Chloroflexota bacterium]
MEVVSGIHQLRVPIPDNPLGHLNCYLIEGKDGWLMVDTGWYTRDAFDSLIEELKGLGLVMADISTMIVTHVHPDHFGLAGRIKHMSPRTELITHRWESDLIEPRYIKLSELRDKMSKLLSRHGVPPSNLSTLESASMPALQYVTVTLPDRTVYGGEIIDTGRFNLEVIWTPGHSPGHICLYEPRNQILLSGDHILPTISPNISYHVQSGDNPLGDYTNALRKLIHLSVSKVLPAHENIFTEFSGRIEEILDHHEKRKAEMQMVLSESPSNAYDISARITWDIPTLTWEQFPPLHQRAAVTETVAHLECLRWEGKVRREMKDQVITYAAA